MSPMRACTRSATTSRNVLSRATVGKAPRNRSGRGRVHERVELRVRAGLGRGEVADHEVGDVRLVTQVPADGAGILVRAPGQLVRAEITPQRVGVGAGAVVLAQERGDLVHDVQGGRPSHREQERAWPMGSPAADGNDGATLDPDRPPPRPPTTQPGAPLQGGADRRRLRTGPGRRRAGRGRHGRGAAGPPDARLRRPVRAAHRAVHRGVRDRRRCSSDGLPSAAGGARALGSGSSRVARARRGSSCALVTGAVGTAVRGAVRLRGRERRRTSRPATPGTDLAGPAERGTAISVALVATTLGAVAGPNLVGPLGRLAIAIGVPALAGPSRSPPSPTSAAAAVLFPAAAARPVPHGPRAPPPPRRHRPPGCARTAPVPVWSQGPR